MGTLLARTVARWKVVVRLIGDFHARVLLSAFYFLILPPFVLMVRVFNDPLGLRPRHTDSFWVRRPAPNTSPASARRQF